MPVATIGAVMWATAAFGFPWFVPLFLLLVSPLIAAGGLYLAGVRSGSISAPTWLPVAGPQRFGDRIPDRYHEEFSPETLHAPAEEPPASAGRLVALGVIYLVSVPVYALVFWGLFG